MTGLDALRHAVKDAGIEVITYVPGYPITTASEAIGAEISVNEKVALEIALGASATGARAMVLVKQVGMNLLADPLTISAMHTIGAGLVIIVGDDLGPKESQVEMDSRYFGQIAELPVLDPKDKNTLYNSIIEAYRLSESLRIPVIIRITSRLLSSEGPYTQPFILKRSEQKFERSAWDLTTSGKHQRHHQDVLSLAEETSEATALNHLKISGNVGIIASGYPASFAGEFGVSLMSVGYAHPLPWKLIRRFVEGHHLVLVAEEPEPLIESQLRMSPKIRGKLTNHLPFGLLDRSDLAKALENLEKIPVHEPHPYESIAERGFIGICEDCPFIPIYRALGRLDVPVAGDAGCIIRATRDPYGSVDIVYGLGSSIGAASGFKIKGIAVIGDFALAHTGLQGLINAIWRHRNVLVVLLKNNIAAMTGGQDAPNLTNLLEMLVPTRYIDLPAQEGEIERALREELIRPSITAIVAEGRCKKYE